MTPDSVVQIVRDMLMVTLMLSAPILAVGLAASVVISLLQIVTSIQDSTFSTVPRLVAVLAALVFSMPWILHKAIAYATLILGNLGRYGQ